MQGADQGPKSFKTWVIWPHVAQAKNRPPGLAFRPRSLRLPGRRGAKSVVAEITRPCLSGEIFDREEQRWALHRRQLGDGGAGFVHRGAAGAVGHQDERYGFAFVALKPWDEREKAGLEAGEIMRKLNARFAREIPDANVFGFLPPAIPGLGQSSGFSMWLQDRSGQDPDYLDRNLKAFLAAARKRPELAGVTSLYNTGARRSTPTWTGTRP